MTVHVQLELLDAANMVWANDLVAQHHYLHRPPDVRTMPEGYRILVRRDVDKRGHFLVGLLIFGRPQCTRLYPWFGSVEDVATDRAEVTRWQVLNLARVWLDPRFQAGGPFCWQDYVPGYTDRRGLWRSTLASTAIGLALDRVSFDYLVRRPPVFVDEPYRIEYVLSYCDTRLHLGTIYAASGFELFRMNSDGIQTWRRRIAPPAPEQDAVIRRLAAQSQRSKRIRAAREQAGVQMELAG